MHHYETLLVSVQDGVGRITLNRPEVMNAIDRRMAAELAAAVGRLGSHKDVRVLLLLGAGGNFCAGGDVRGMREAGTRSVEQARQDMALYRDMTLVLHGVEKPLIAAADGVAYGAGFSLLLLADMVLLGERSRLSMVFGRVGLIPDCGALYTLPRVVGLQRARELVFSAREIDATQALAMGVAMEVVASDSLVERAQAIASALTLASPLALSLAKSRLNLSFDSDLATMLDSESEGQAQALDSDHHREAVRRFLTSEVSAFRWPDSEA